MHSTAHALFGYRVRGVGSGELEPWPLYWPNSVSCGTLPRMEATSGGRRETRLLLMTIAVSAVMLLLLASFRFPGEATLPPPELATAPLERMIARATYDELAAIMAEVERRITPTVVVVPVQAEHGDTSYLPAVRITPDRAIALLGPGERIASGPSGEAPVVLGRDLARHLVVLQVAARPGDVVTPRTGTPRPGPRYAVVVDATAQGIAVRPVYIGRTDVFNDPRTGDSMLSIGAVQQTLPRGSAVFTLDGTFVGLTLESAGLVTLQSAQTLTAAAETAPPSPAPIGDLGLEVQTLTAPLARAAGVPAGVIVASVDPDGPAAGRLRPHDVIQAIDDRPIQTLAGYHQVVAGREPGTAVTLTVARGGKTRSETVDVRAPWRGGPADRTGGLILQHRPGSGTEVLGTEPGSPAARAGLRAGDLVTAVGERATPEPTDLLKAYAAARSGDLLLLTVRRGRQHQVVALEKS